MSKVVLITGGGSEIGYETACRFAENHYQVILTYQTQKEKTEMIAQELTEKYGTTNLAVFCDLKEEESIQKVCQVIKEQFQRIDVLVNNAAVCYDSLYHEKSKEKFMETLEVNVVGTFLISRMIGEMMYEQKSGSIINLSSTNGLNQYFPMSLDYDASKTAILSLTHNLSLNYSPYVRVNAVLPGFIGTKKELADLDEEYIEMEKEKIFLQRLGTAKEVAQVIFFLAGDEASYINNAIIKVDGGMR